MSNIGILSGPSGAAFVLLILGSPGLPLGGHPRRTAVARHRIWGAPLGAAGAFCPLRLSASATKPLAFMSSTKART